MYAELYADLEAFWSAAADFLLGDPVLCSVVLTNIERRRTGQASDAEPPRWVLVCDRNGTTTGAAMWTPPLPIVLTPMPVVAVEAVVEALAAADAALPGVSGPIEEAAAFVAGWTSRHPTVGAEVWQQQRVHVLDQVTPPSPPPGAMRRADRSDRDLVLRWSHAFDHEVAGSPSAEHRGEAALAELPPERRAAVEANLAAGRCWLWEDGVPASYVGCSPPVGGIARVGPVYTPPELRGRGYASALVAGVSQLLLADGWRCALYTDLANPTSNKIYACVGYRPVSDVTAYTFR